MTGLRRLPACLFALLLLIFTAGAVEARQMVAVSKDEVNLRSGPGTRHDAQWVLGRGYPLQVTGRKGDWLQVRDFENDRGWIYRALTARTPHHVVKATIANIRSGPGTGRRVVGKAEYGDVLRTLERRRDWVKIRHESGLVGWIARRLLWGW